MVLKLCLKAPLSKWREDSQGPWEPRSWEGLMVTRWARGQALNSVWSLAPVRITKARCRAVIDKQDQSDKVRKKKKITSQVRSSKQQWQVQKMANLQRTRTEVKWVPGPREIPVRLPRAIKHCPQILTVIKVSPIKTPISLSRKEKK